MKFAREFKAALQSGDFPEEWCQAAIPYPALKKCLTKIRAELQSMGLDVESLRQLLAAQAVLADGDPIPLAKYKFDVTDADVRPHLTLFVDLADGVVVDASLSPASRAFLEKQATIRRGSVAALPTSPSTDDEMALDASETSTTPSPDPPEAGNVDTRAAVAGADTPADTPAAHIQHVEVTLTADGEFFRLMDREMHALEQLTAAEQAAITAEVTALGTAVAAVARPERKPSFWQRQKANNSSGSSSSSSNKSKKKAISGAAATAPAAVTDLPRWRALFELYLDAQVFFSTRERDHGQARTAAQAARQLDWFQDQVRARGLLAACQLPASAAAYRQFLLLNKRLYLNLRFGELNERAQAKILKKFDKVTALGVAETFPAVLAQRHRRPVGPAAAAAAAARDVCARIAEDVVAVVPRLADYTCPVCLGLAWLPVRLRCRHVFCVRCVIKLQRDGQRFCPLCRGEVVLEADLDNLDLDLEKFLKRYFRQEADEKQKANELERGIELFGDGYKPTSCVVM